MTRLSALLGLLLLASATAAQAPERPPLPLADRPLTVADGSALTLATAAGREGLVVAFWSTACPWTDRYAARLAELVDGYARAGVGFVLVTSGGVVRGAAVAGAVAPVGAEPAAPALRRPPAAAGLPAPYVVDADGALAAAFGARAAPHVFFYGPDRTLVYDGAIDDSPADADRVRTPYLRQALDESIAGLPVEVMKTQAFGCTIREQP